MSREEEALLKSIAEVPGDDLRRLIYADWLDECGYEASGCDRSAQARFIRNQIQYNNGGVIERIPIQIEGGTRWEDLLWFSPWEGVGNSAALVVQLKSLDRCIVWHRGFPALVSCTHRQWHQNHWRFPVPIYLYLGGTQNGVWGFDGEQRISVIRSNIRYKPTSDFRLDMKNLFDNVIACEDDPVIWWQISELVDMGYIHQEEYDNVYIVKTPADV